jgi:hypothetical protein
MRDATTGTESLLDLLADIRRGVLALPDFQRDFVWRPVETKDLLHTVLNRWPAGSILLYEFSEGFLQPRPFVEAPPLAQPGPGRLVLDGQQRLTALWQALVASGEFEFFLKLRPYLKNQNLEDAIDYLPTKEFQKSLSTPEQQLADLVLPFTQAASGFARWRDRITDLLPDSAQRSQLRDELQEVDDKILAAIRNYQLPFMQLKKETPLPAICKIFEVTNKRGIKLTAFELMVAKVAPRRENLRSRWQDVLDSWETVAEASAQEVVLPLLPLQVTSIRKPAGAGIRQSDVLALSADEVLAEWDDAVTGIVEALDFLKNECGLLSSRWLPYSTMLVPLAAVMVDISGLKGHKRGRALRNLSRWFWASFASSYEKGANTQAVSDYSTLRTWLLADGGTTPKVVSAFSFDPQELRSSRRSQPSLYRATILLTLKIGARDFHLTTRLTPEMVSEGKVDAHHLFPARFLSEKNVDNELINAISNLALIDRATNRRIGKSRPSLYLREMETEQGTAQLRAILESHLLAVTPESGFWSDSYEVFLDERSKLIAEQLVLLVNPRDEDLGG